jgi:hypothetical protein
MNRRSLIQTNPYLRDSKNRQKLLSVAVSSSTAIEGVHGVVPEVASFRSRAGKPAMVREPAVSSGSRR